MAPVSVYLASYFSADRPREPLDDDIEQLSAQLERAKALIAATIAPQQQVAPFRCLMEASTSNGSHYDKYVAPYSNSSLYSFAYAPGVPAVASAARYTYADARPFEHAFSFGAARITEPPQESRLSVAANLALSLSTSILDSRRFTAYACCLCRSFASFSRGASSRGIPLLGAIGLSAPGCYSVNSLAPPF